MRTPKDLPREGRSPGFLLQLLMKPISVMPRGGILGRWQTSQTTPRKLATGDNMRQPNIHAMPGGSVPPPLMRLMERSASCDAFCLAAPDAEGDSPEAVGEAWGGCFHHFTHTQAYLFI